MKQSDFEALVWTQWAKAPNEKIQPEEIRPMKNVQTYSRQDALAQDTEWQFTAWAEPYPDDDDPWMSPNHPTNRDKRVIESVTGIWMELINEELFKLKEVMIDIDDTKIIEKKDEDGNVIETTQQMGYRSDVPFTSTFNKSVYDVIQKEHMRLQTDVGQSIYTKALLRFEVWFKANGFIEAHGHEIEPFWAKAYTGAVAINEPDAETPPPLSNDHKWEDVLLEIQLLKKGVFQLRVFHPSLDKQNGVVVPLGNWQDKLRDILIMHGAELSIYLDPEILIRNWGKRWEVDSITKQDINKLRAQLKSAIGITNQKPIFDMRNGKWQFQPYIRLHKNFHHKVTGRILSEDDTELLHAYAYMQPRWLLEKLGI